MKTIHGDLQQPVVAPPLAETKADTEMEEPARCALEPATLRVILSRTKGLLAAETEAVKSSIVNRRKYAEGFHTGRASVYAEWAESAEKLLAESERGTSERGRNDQTEGSAGSADPQP